MYPKLTGRTRYRASAILGRLILQVEVECRAGGDPLAGGGGVKRLWRDAKVEDISALSDLPQPEVVQV